MEGEDDHGAQGFDQQQAQSKSEGSLFCVLMMSELLGKEGMCWHCDFDSTIRFCHSHNTGSVYTQLDGQF